MAQTLLLDQYWDLTLDGNGNIAVASEPLAQAQDAASNIKLFQGELYYDTTVGEPYFQDTLGYLPPLSLLRARFVTAAKQVPGVTSALCFFTSFVDRELSGQVQIIDSTGQVVSAANF